MAAVVARPNVQHPQRVPLGGLPAVWCSGARSRSLSTNTQASWKMCSFGWRAERGCQPTSSRPPAFSLTFCASDFRYCVLSLIGYKLNRNMQRKVARAMPKAPSLSKKADAQTSVISLPILNKQGTAGLTPMNFRVPPNFHREFKLYAVQHGMSMVALLQESFRLMKERRAK